MHEGEAIQAGAIGVSVVTGCDEPAGHYVPKQLADSGAAGALSLAAHLDSRFRIQNATSMDCYIFS
jgi:hypothetical protein